MPEVLLAMLLAVQDASPPQTAMPSVAAPADDAADAAAVAAANREVRQAAATSASQFRDAQEHYREQQKDYQATMADVARQAAAYQASRAEFEAQQKRYALAMEQYRQAVSAAPVGPRQTAPVRAAEPTAKDEKRTCRNVLPPGSHIARKECHTRRGWSYGDE